MLVPALTLLPFTVSWAFSHRARARARSVVPILIPQLVTPRFGLPVAPTLAFPAACRLRVRFHRQQVRRRVGGRWPWTSSAFGSRSITPILFPLGRDCHTQRDFYQLHLIDLLTSQNVGAYWIALGYYTGYFLSKTAIEVGGYSIAPISGSGTAWFWSPWPMPWEVVLYIFLHEWLIFYGKCRKYARPMDVMLWDDVFLSHLHVHRFEVENCQFLSWSLSP